MKDTLPLYSVEDQGEKDVIVYCPSCNEQFAAYEPDWRIANHCAAARCPCCHKAYLREKVIKDSDNL